MGKGEVESTLSINDDILENVPLRKEREKQVLHHEDEEEDIGTFRLICASMCTVGITFGFNAEFVLGTPMFISLGMSHFLTSFAWLAGPLSGLFFQPIIGAISDRYTGRFGRRRPFIILGAIISVVGLICFANPQWLAVICGQPDNTTIQIVFAIVSLWVLNIGLNIMQGPGWALVMDLCGSKNQKKGNAVVSTLAAASGILTNLLGFVNLVKIFPFFQDSAHALFYIGVIVVILSLIPTIIAAREKRYVPENNPDIKQGSWFREIFAVFTGMNKQTLSLVAIMLFAFGAFSPFQFYFTDYFGQEVYGGVADAPAGSTDYNNYQEGVRMGSLGFCLMQTVAFIYSPVLPILLKTFKFRVMFVVGLAAGAFSFLMPIIPYVVNPAPSEVVFAVSGLLSASNYIIPYSIVGEVNSKTDSGRYVALLNSVQVIAQMLANFLSSIVMQLTGSTTYGIAVGGVFAVIALILALFLNFFTLEPKK